METWKFLSTKTELRDSVALLSDLRERLTGAQARHQEIAAMHRVLSALSRDWRQPLSQGPLPRTERMALLEQSTTIGGFMFDIKTANGAHLIWPEELVTYLDDRNGLDTSCAAFTEGRMRPFKDALTSPCPRCKRPAPVVLHMHTFAKPHVFDRHHMDHGPAGPHWRLLTACAHCMVVRPYGDKGSPCPRCVA